MARLYGDEQFPREVVELLRQMGHNILTVQEAGKDNQKIPDEEVLAFAVSENRAVLTLNRRHFIRLHSSQPDHAGIIVCTEDKNNLALAQRIHDTILLLDSDVENQLIRVNRPNQ